MDRVFIAFALILVSIIIMRLLLHWAITGNPFATAREVVEEIIKSINKNE